ncbi:hypothetical protein GCM10017779_34320 [Streptomyces capillispiralis]|nr:hypothetical protein GCM10017779_34320 [Streptomyces capillispiralis]
MRARFPGAHARPGAVAARRARGRPCGLTTAVRRVPPPARDGPGRRRPPAVLVLLAPHHPAPMPRVHRLADLGGHDSARPERRASDEKDLPLPIPGSG